MPCVSFNMRINKRQKRENIRQETREQTDNTRGNKADKIEITHRSQHEQY